MIWNRQHESDDDVDLFIGTSTSRMMLGIFAPTLRAASI
jgi:hypothetical protein